MLIMNRRYNCTSYHKIHRFMPVIVYQTKIPSGVTWNILSTERDPTNFEELRAITLR